MGGQAGDTQPAWRGTGPHAGALGGGAAYGVLLWVVGALTLMPLMLGMNDMVLVVGSTQLLSLMGHIIFGMILGAVYWRLNR